jgi:glutathione S-transferase
VLPADPKDRARARWFEEFADTRLGDLFIWGLFYQKIVHPLVWGEPGDEQRISRTVGEDAPIALDYLEGELPEDGWLFRDFGIADIAIASFFRNAAYAGFEPDAARSPRVARFVRRALAHEAFAHTLPFEDIQRSVDIKGRRQALLDAGAPLTADTLGEPVARKGMMRL